MEKKELEMLLRNHHSDAYIWSVQCCNYNEDDGKDVLQEVYLKVLEGKAKFNAHSTFKIWLYSVIRYSAIDHLRKQLRYDHIGVDNVDIQDEGRDENYYSAMLKKLPKRQQEVLVMSFYHGMTLEEVANVLDVHVGTVRTHYSRGKEALRELIKREEV